MATTRRALWVVAAIPVAYAASYGTTRLVQQHQLYTPGHERTLVAPPAELGLPVERVQIRTRDGVTLVGWTIAVPRTVPADSAPWLIIFHGKAGNIAVPRRLEHYAALRQIGLNILAVDYRGFGESTGKPSEDGLYRDADAIYRYLRDVRGVPASRIIIYGHSLGTAVAIDLAARVPAAGLIVEGAFTSITDVAQELYPWAPVRWLPVSAFASIDKIGSVAMPKLILHATADTRIPIEHGRRLYARATGSKRFVELGGGHSDAFEADSARYFTTITRFVAEVTRTR